MIKGSKTLNLTKGIIYLFSENHNLISLRLYAKSIPIHIHIMTESLRNIDNAIGIRVCLEDIICISCTLAINLKGKLGKMKRQKNSLKRGERSDAYLTHICEKNTMR